MFLLYNLILTLLSPIWVPWMIWRSKKRQESPNWQERQGIYNSIPKKEKGEKRIWVHAVSLGEMIAVKPFLQELKQQKPEVKIILSTTTSSGHQSAREKLTEWFDYLVYFPIDLPRFQLRAMQRVRPDVIAIMETELWFNFLWAADVFNAPAYIVNGRNSDRAFKNSQKVKWFYKAMFKYLKGCLVQTQADAERFSYLGAQRVHVLGNVKFDEAASEIQSTTDWKKELYIPLNHRVVVIGSTRSEYEVELTQRAIIPILTENPHLTVIHAPRHIESAEEVMSAMKSLLPPNSSISCGFRSKNEKATYLVLDSYGELAGVYNIADIVVIGGGFDMLGGQNLIQPLALGKPVIHGPNMFNFRDIATTSVSAGASMVCNTSLELQHSIESLLSDETQRGTMSQCASELVQKNLGASKRYAEAVLAELD